MEDECRSIEHPALTAALNATEMASNFPWCILSGPSEYMGLEHIPVHVGKWMCNGEGDPKS
eukprot:2321216-Ditylum_brightwellii.AAC.1